MRLDSSGLSWAPVAVSYEHGKEILVHKTKKVLEFLKHCKPLKSHSDLWIYTVVVAMNKTM